VRRDARHRALVRGHVAGHSYGIPAAYLVPVKVRIWLKPRHRRAHALRVVTTRTGGDFSTTVVSRHPGALRFEVLGRPGIFRHVIRAGGLSLL